jgi:acyl-CoA thioester hydrolase
MLIPIRWGDMDSLNHVNNAEYMRYFEEARVAWSLHHGFRKHREQGGMIIAKATINYLKPLNYPGTVRSEIFTRCIGNSSFELHQALTAEGDEAPAATGDYVVVWFDYVNNKSAPVPPSVRAVLEGRP